MDNRFIVVPRNVGNAKTAKVRLADILAQLSKKVKNPPLLMNGRKQFMEHIYSPLALPLGELSPQATERVLPPLFPISIFASLRHLSQRESQGVLANNKQAQQIIPLYLLTI